MTVFRVLGDDVDYTIYSIRSPDCAAGAANDFDPIYVFKQHILEFPIDAGKKRRIDVSAIDQDKYGF